MGKFQEIMSVYEMHHFFLAGTICFSIVWICNLITLFYYWSNYIWSQRVQSMIMLVFYIFLIGVFIKSYQTHYFTSKVNKIENKDGFCSADEIEEIMS